MCSFWNVPFLKSDIDGMCPFWNMIYKESATFGLCSFWNVFLIECDKEWNATKLIETKLILDVIFVNIQSSKLFYHSLIRTFNFLSFQSPRKKAFYATLGNCSIYLLLRQSIRSSRQQKRKFTGRI